MPMPSAAAVPWGTRAAALFEIGDELGARAGDAQNPRRRTGLLALRCLSAFAKKQFELFADGFGPASALTPDPKFPAPFLLDVMIRQVAYDVDVLLRALAQREEPNSTAGMRAILDLADHLAAHALQPAVRARLAEETAVMTYFQKSPSIRLLPYVPLALIGIDAVAIHDTARLVGVAHEVGHHVYRQMTVNYQSGLDEQIIERAAAPAATQWPAWLEAWEEEVFADIYAALVAGPVAGLSVQALLMDALPAALTIDDGDHPLGVLRPLIYTQALRKIAAVRKDGALAQRINHAAAALDANWATYVETLGKQTAFTPAGDSKPVVLAAARDLVRRYVDQMLAQKFAALLKDHTEPAWSEGISTDNTADLMDLYAQFAGALLAGNESHLPELALARRGQMVEVVPQVPGVRGGQRIVGQIGDLYLDTLRDQALTGQKHLQPGEWKAVFLAGDWVTEAGGTGITPVKR